MAVMCNQVECRLFKCGVNWPEYMYGTTISVSKNHIMYKKYPFSATHFK